MARDPMTRAEARRHRLLALLSDGEFHSGEKLAKRLRISRGGIWKIVSALRELGVDVQSVPRQGYKLPCAVDLYDRSAILAAMSAETRAALTRADVLLTVDSTNRFVADLEEALEPGQAQLRDAAGAGWRRSGPESVCRSVGGLRKRRRRSPR
jgi:BirA family biotin operon repressor/biotin-[acetyl-CoA-carboxylase] ligase